MDSLAVAESSKEEYRSAISTPSCSHAVDLDFETKDAEGKYVTPEGALKYKILSSASTEAVTTAAGQLNPAHGVVGMAGVGKTIALQGLACDTDIRERFSRWHPVREPRSGCNSSNSHWRNWESNDYVRSFCKCRKGE